MVLNLNSIPGTLNFCVRLKKYDTVFKGVGGVNGEIMLHNIKTQINELNCHKYPNTGCFFFTGPPAKKLKYGKPRLGEVFHTLTF